MFKDLIECLVPVLITIGILIYIPAVQISWKKRAERLANETDTEKLVRQRKEIRGIAIGIFFVCGASFIGAVGYLEDYLRIGDKHYLLEFIRILFLSGMLMVIGVGYWRAKRWGLWLSLFWSLIVLLDSIVFQRQTIWIIVFNMVLHGFLIYWLTKNYSFAYERT